MTWPVPSNLVPTPIGNLGDISQRCRDTLALADFIAAEDTRVSLKLLNHLGIKKPLVSYYEHNQAESGEKILRRLLAGETCALVSDAGSPAISDPGEALVAQCAAGRRDGLRHPGTLRRHHGPGRFRACPPGGLPSRGFLSTNRKSRREHLDSLRDEVRTMVFYEAPQQAPGHVGGHGRRVRRGTADQHLPGADQAPRGDFPHHPGRGHRPLRGCAAPGRGTSWWWRALHPRAAQSVTLEEALALVETLMDRGA